MPLRIAFTFPTEPFGRPPGPFFFGGRVRELEDELDAAAAGVLLSPPEKMWKHV